MKSQPELNNYGHRTTPREKQILQLIVDGYPTNEIGLLLAISSRTVESYKQHLFRRFGVNSITQVGGIALRENTEK